MCLAIPGKIIGITDNAPLTRRGKVSFGGLVKEVNLSFVPEADVNNYVMVHVGFAISQVDEKEADQVFEYLREIDELSELKDGEI
ncbi:MAG TPA: HypC/HybG/HupF family hydrogenase formation chaperone [Thermodesulfobacteriota bacterium]|nr:HypC/HybG/HupF family hydrogenase formation chaperone [Thermodesulfobacteriota bacterium]